MGIEVASNKRFLSTSSARSAEDWDELLRCQVDLSIACELNMLMENERWNRASAVVDAGSGNGYYLSKLREFFPTKSYLGVDVSPKLTSSAILRHPEIEFRIADFFELEMPPVDILIMRFFVQHIGDFGAILRQARRLLRSGGALIIIEADLSRSTMLPVPRMFVEMLTTYDRSSKNDGGLKNRLLADVDGLIAGTAEDWRLVEEVDSSTALVGPFASCKILTVFRKWVDLAERSEMFSFGFADVREELSRWSERSASFVNLVTRMFVLEPLPVAIRG